VVNGGLKIELGRMYKWISWFCRGWREEDDGGFLLVGGGRNWSKMKKEGRGKMVKFLLLFYVREKEDEGIESGGRFGCEG
jgi:hypothetical protein